MNMLRTHKVCAIVWLVRQTHRHRKGRLMAEKKVRVGMIGLGSISYAHEAGYSELGEACQIVALCDINEEEVNNRIGMYEGAKGYTRYQDLLDNPEVDMVDIIVPHVLHYEIAKAAIENGKHVLVEKPITVKSEQGEELDRAGKEGRAEIQRGRKYPFCDRLPEGRGDPQARDPGRYLDRAHVDRRQRSLPHQGSQLCGTAKRHTAG